MVSGYRAVDIALKIVVKCLGLKYRDHNFFRKKLLSLIMVSTAESETLNKSVNSNGRDSIPGNNNYYGNE